MSETTSTSVAAAAAAGTAREFRTKMAQRIRERVMQDYGGPDTARRAVLTLVAEERYDEALVEIKKYAASRPEYPQFAERAARYLSYSEGLINGIKAKRSFPGVHMLSMSKQQELYERAMQHFDDLRATLKRVEAIEREVKLEDLRSTVWVVKATIYSAIALLAVAVMIELSRGVVSSADAVLESAASDGTNWVFDKLGI